MDYIPRTDDMRFVFEQVLDAPGQFAALSAHADTDGALIRQVLEEAARFVAEKIAPLQRSGDEIGCRWEAGLVTMPPGFRDSYQAFWRAGWPALACAQADGGQGLPVLMEALVFEMLSAANHGWTMAPGLLHGAYECIRHHASEPLRDRYLAKVASGEWLATMCLTEAHAGSDLGLVRTRAVPLADGSHAISGTKIFISGGEHDLTDNIVHLVLARLPDAPAGPKGLSLFLAPKVLPDGSVNSIHCERIEDKMGLHGSPTCVMRFDQATGWLVGEPGRGLNAMFVMMNAARLHVALQGIGLLEAAWQKADAYARERRQMRAPRAGGAHHGPDLIIEHPAVQRLLDTQRAWVDGMRTVGYQTAIELDIGQHHPDPKRRERAQRWCALVTPVLKAACTDQAFLGASDCLQVFGGHGYVREWGIEQIVRDARISMIYEGTNQIQAIDLLVRKVLPDGGRSMAVLLAELAADLPPGAEARRAIDALDGITTRLCTAAGADPRLPFEVADDYLRAVALGLLGWAWQRIAAVGDTRFDSGRAAHARWVRPEFDMRKAIIEERLGGC